MEKLLCDMSGHGTTAKEAEESLKRLRELEQTRQGRQGTEKGMPTSQFVPEVKQIGSRPQN